MSPEHAPSQALTALILAQSRIGIPGSTGRQA